MFVFVGANQGVVPREVQQQYVRDHPHVTVELLEGSNAETYPKMVAAKQANPNRPLVHFGYFNAEASARGDLQQMWLPLDPQVVTHLADILDAYRRPANHGVGWGLTPVVLAYNTDKVKTPPASWNDLWDPKYRGRVLLRQAPNFFLNGLITAARLNGGSEKAIDRGFEIVSRAAQDGQIHSFFNSTDQIKTLLTRGDVWLAPAFGSMVVTWKAEGAPVDYVIPREGMVAVPQYLQLVAGSSPAQQYHAQALINLLLEPRALGRYCDLTNSAPASRRVQLAARLAKEPAYGREAAEGAMQIDWQTVSAQSAAWLERWNREVKARMR
jgi:putative spermidine/putrescine transport system substrate-binding protein